MNFDHRKRIKKLTDKVSDNLCKIHDCMLLGIAEINRAGVVAVHEAH